MINLGISRRAALMGAGAIAAWASSPARALMAKTGAAPLPSAVESLLARMTVEEKAGQCTLMAAAWAGGAANALNPITATATFDEQLDDVTYGKVPKSISRSVPCAPSNNKDFPLLIALSKYLVVSII